MWEQEYNQEHTVACYVLSVAGLSLAQAINKTLPLHIFFPEKMQISSQGSTSFTSLSACVGKHFSRFSAHIFFTAAGIAVRCIAPHLKHKKEDPAVLVCDEKAQHVISLLSGHMGGANTLTKRVAKILHSQAVITTASDIYAVPAVDMLAKAHDCTVLDWGQIKFCNARLIEQRHNENTLSVYDPCTILGPLPTEHFTRKTRAELDTAEPTLMVHWQELVPMPFAVRMVPPVICVGIGCKKNTPAACIHKAIKEALADESLMQFYGALIHERALCCLTTVDIKAEEAGLMETAKNLALPLHIFSPQELAAMPSVHHSPKAAEILGVEHICVCESAALKAVEKIFHSKGQLVLAKKSYARQVTVALAIAEKYNISDK